MQSSPLNGIEYFFQGFSLIFQPGIRRWVIIPLLINVMLFSALIYFSWLQFQAVNEIVVNQVESWVPNWEWLVELVRWLMLPLFLVIALIGVFFSFTFMANLIGGPFNGLLAAAVEKHLTGKAPDSPSESWSQIFFDPISRLLYYLRWVIVLLIISLIPVINIASPMFWFLFSAWIISLEYSSASMENHGYRGAEIRQILAKKRIMTLGFGSTVLVAMLIPVVNFLVMPTAVAGATCMWLSEFKRDY